MFGQSVPFLLQFLQPFDLLSVTRQRMTPSNFSEPVVSQSQRRDLCNGVYFLIPNKYPIDYHRLPGTCRKPFIHLLKNSINQIRPRSTCSIPFAPSNNIDAGAQVGSSCALGAGDGQGGGRRGRAPPQEPRSTG